MLGSLNTASLIVDGVVVVALVTVVVLGTKVPSGNVLVLSKIIFSFDVIITVPSPPFLPIPGIVYGSCLLPAASYLPFAAAPNSVLAASLIIANLPA